MIFNSYYFREITSPRNYNFYISIFSPTALASQLIKFVLITFPNIIFFTFRMNNSIDISNSNTLCGIRCSGNISQLNLHRTISNHTTCMKHAVVHVWLAEYRVVFSCWICHTNAKYYFKSSCYSHLFFGMTLSFLTKIVIISHIYLKHGVFVFPKFQLKFHIVASRCDFFTFNVSSKSFYVYVNEDKFFLVMNAPNVKEWTSLYTCPTFVWASNDEIYT